jgi:hypothetical protein
MIQTEKQELIDNHDIKLKWLSYLSDVVKMDSNIELEEMLDKYFTNESNLRQLNRYVKDSGLKTIGTFRNEYKEI